MGNLPVLYSISSLITSEAKWGIFPKGSEYHCLQLFTDEAEILDMNMNTDRMRRRPLMTWASDILKAGCRKLLLIKSRWVLREMNGMLL